MLRLQLCLYEGGLRVLRVHELHARLLLHRLLNGHADRVIVWSCPKKPPWTIHPGRFHFAPQTPVRAGAWCEPLSDVANRDGFDGTWGAPVEIIRTEFRNLALAKPDGIR
jgi:hypothetical protein